MKKSPPKTSDDILAHRLRGLMLWHEGMALNETQLAMATGISQPTINRILAGKQRAGIDTVSTLARFFKLSIEQLVSCETYVPAYRISDGLYAMVYDYVTDMGYDVPPRKMGQLIKALVKELEAMQHGK